MKKKLQIHEAAIEALNYFQDETTYIEIFNYIINNELFDFGAKKEKHEQILRKIIERKCINSNLSYKTKELLFYKNKNKYGLLEWLSPKELKELTILDNKEQENDLKLLKEKIHQAELKLQKIDSANYNYDSFEKNYNLFKEEQKKLHEDNEAIQQIINSFNREKDNVYNLIKNLKNTKQQLNFEKLDNGFIELLTKKEQNKKNILKILKYFGFSIFIIPFIAVFLIFENFKLSYTLSIPLLTIEVFLVYYFRIILHNYNSLEEQILQLENKSAILKFVTNYIEFKKDNDVKQEDIAKFEEIIFSKISPNMKTIPTSPDVVSIIEKIAAIVKSK